MTGDFFHYTLLNDHRFQSFAGIAGGFADQTFLENEVQIRSLVEFDSQLGEVHLQATPWLGHLASVMTWATIVLEALVTLAFLSPASFPLFRWRHLLLVEFALGTYFLAPSSGWAGC